MKKFLMFSLVAISFASGISACAQQDKSKRPSPPAKVSETTVKGQTITIDYSAPSVKGRTIGKEIATYGKVWRTGANEATVFEITKDAKIDNKHALPAGKYSLYTIPGEEKWTIIFNKKWQQWGTEYSEADDALRIQVDAKKTTKSTEQMTFTINKEGRVTLLWGNTAVNFYVM